MQEGASDFGSGAPSGAPGADAVGFGRYAPSPTGDFHLGNLRTALLAWAFARQAGLGFLMRMEDLDARCRPEHATRQLEDLEALGIDWDGPVIWQSKLGERYEDAYARMLRDGLLYECYCTRRELANVASAPHMPPGSYPGTCRDLGPAEREAGRAKLAGMARGPAMRLRADLAGACGGGLALDSGTGAPASRILAVKDAICGPYTGTVDDLVIRRGDGVWSYNFVSVLDDGADGVVQVVRGNDLLPSAPRQARLAALLGFDAPAYAHVPMVFNTERVRLAKRDGAVTMRALADFGWTPADIIQLIGQSLGVPEARTAEEFAQAVSMESLAWVGVDGDLGTGIGSGEGADSGTGTTPQLETAPGTWLVDPAALEAGPAAVLG